MSTSRYTVRVTKDYLTFCSAHFVCFHGQCERLHGHNYRVAAEIEGPLDDDFLVFDFIVLKGILREIVNALDHRMLVPSKSPTLRVSEEGASIRIAYRDKTWVVPREDCVLLPIESTTAELLARWICGRLEEELRLRAGRSAVPAAAPEVLRVEVEESQGQSAVYEAVRGAAPRGG